MSDDPPKDYASGDDGISQQNNSAPSSLAVVKLFDRTPSWVYLLISILAFVLALGMWLDARRMADDFNEVRQLLQNAQAAIVDSVRDAALAAERADKAERSAALNREYAVQVVGQLNRMGFPVISPGETGHPPALPEDYERLDDFIQQKEQAP